MKTQIATVVFCLPALALTLFVPACATQPPAKHPNAVQLTQFADHVRIEIHGQLFTEYRTNAANP